MTTPQASSYALLIQSILAACGIDVPAAHLSELRLSVSYDTFIGKRQETGPLKISTIAVSISGIGLSMTFTGDDGSQLLLCADPSAAIPLIFRTPDSKIQFGCQYTFSAVPMEAEAQCQLSFAALD